MMKSLAFGLALVFTVASAAIAQESPVEIQMGIDSCEGELSLTRGPGEVVTVRACVSSGGSPKADVPIVLIEEGPSPMTRREAVTDAEGSSELDLSSPASGFSRVIACASEACSQIVVVTWLLGGRHPIEPEVVPPTVHFGGSGLSPGVPLATKVSVAEEGKGFACNQGPGSTGVTVPGFAAVKEAVPVRDKHPRTGVETDSIDVKTSQHFLAGSVIYGVPAVAFVSIKDRQGPVDTGGPFPLQGFNRILAIWSSGEANFGKQELRYTGGSWKQAEPAFTAVIGARGIQFFLDEPVADIADTASAGARIGPSCSGVGYDKLKTRSKAIPDPVDDKTATGPALGLFLLVVLGALTAGVFRSSRPPSGGLVVEIPSGPMVRVERSDIRYDTHGRPTSYVEVIELPDGTTRTTRARIGQESLIMEMPEMLDVADWEDERLNSRRDDVLTDRNGRLESFVEEIVASDGTISRIRISHIVYDGNNRVVRFSRSTDPTANSMSTKARSEIVSLDHEGAGLGGSSPVLAEAEEMLRNDIRFDDEGHVASYVAAVHTNGSGRVEIEGEDIRFVPGVPRALFECGERFAAGLAFVSNPNRGLVRVRNVLTSWFRQHGCKVSLSVKDKSGHPMSGARFMFGSTRGVLDPRGAKTIWVMNAGNYAVGLLSMDDRDPDSEHLDSTSGSELLGWVVVEDIPGWVEARFTET